jgi:hypothetical protein
MPQIFNKSEFATKLQPLYAEKNQARKLARSSSHPKKERVPI